MGELSPWHWAIVIIALMVLFGFRRLPDAARSIGRSARILKSELRAPEPEAPPSEAHASAPPTTPTGPETAASTTDSTITTSQSPPRHN